MSLLFSSGYFRYIFLCFSDDRLLICVMYIRMQCKVLTDSYITVYIYISQRLRTIRQRQTSTFEAHTGPWIQPTVLSYTDIYTSIVIKEFHFNAFAVRRRCTLHIANTTYGQTEGAHWYASTKCGAEKLAMKGTSQNHCNEHWDGRLRDDRLDFLNATIWMFSTNYALRPQLDMLLCLYADTAMCMIIMHIIITNYVRHLHAIFTYTSCRNSRMNERSEMEKDSLTCMFIERKFVYSYWFA